MSELYVSNRDVTVTSTAGHTIRFTKGEPKFVPFALRRQCLDLGVLPVDGTPPEITEGAPPPPPDAPMSLQEREELIETAMTEMVETKKRGDFTAVGLPRVDALSRITGFEVSPAERDRLWLARQRQG